MNLDAQTVGDSGEHAEFGEGSSSHTSRTIPSGSHRAPGGCDLDASARSRILSDA